MVAPWQPSRALRSPYFYAVFAIDLACLCLLVYNDVLYFCYRFQKLQLLKRDQSVPIGLFNVGIIGIYVANTPPSLYILCTDQTQYPLNIYVIIKSEKD